MFGTEYITCTVPVFQTDKTATDLTKVTEDYGLQAAAGLENVNLVVKDNIGNYFVKLNNSGTFFH